VLLDIETLWGASRDSGQESAVPRGGPLVEDEFSSGDREVLYRVIERRRDVRAFRPDPIPSETLYRLLSAAHHAPSVGLMQPWNFIVIQDAGTKTRIKEIFLRANEEAAAHYSGPREMLYRSLKLEGIEEAPINLCVTADRTRSGPHVLGRNTIVDTDLYSTCCAIENLWLAARVEGIGVGWVSILSIDEVRTVLSIPEHVVVVAYLCLGYAQEFFDEPELQRRRWASRVPLDQLVYRERWGQSAS
jgi:5,6-dimethylbenzimidazole synthase